MAQDYRVHLNGEYCISMPADDEAHAIQRGKQNILALLRQVGKPGELEAAQVGRWHATLEGEAFYDISKYG